MPTPPPPVAHQFKPGEQWRGNPGGRPKGRSLTSVLNDLLDSETLGGKPLPGGKTALEMLGEVLLKEALKGKFPFVKEILERRDGKVPDQVHVEDIRKSYDVGNSPDDL